MGINGKEGFKDIVFLCRCGEIVKETLLIWEDYGFSITKCKACGERYKIENDGKTTTVRHLSICASRAF